MGYLLLLLLLLTATTAITSADWILANSSSRERSAAVVGLCLVFFGVVARIRYAFCGSQKVSLCGCLIRLGRFVEFGSFDKMQFQTSRRRQA